MTDDLHLLLPLASPVRFAVVSFMLAILVASDYVETREETWELTFTCT